MTAKEALENLWYGQKSTETYETVDNALNRLEKLEKVLNDKLYYSPNCFNSAGKTYIDLCVEDDAPEFNLLKEYLK